MSNIDRYIEAATRKNTRRSYQSAVEHFEVTWGGHLPATANQVAQYLADYAGRLSVNTLRQRLSALAQWHLDQGFADPTKAPIVKKVLKGIGELHPTREKQAKALQLEQLEQLAVWLDQQLAVALQVEDRKAILLHSRNKALVLVGFWRGFRSDELSRLDIEHITTSPGQGMEIYLPRSKGDRQNQGRSHKTPALSRLCPVSAYLDWIHNAGLTSGPVFRKVTHWGRIEEKGLHPDSINTLLRELFTLAGFAGPELYSSHSLRRGFASWANTNQWDIKTLMEYVGWKDVQSAMRYIDAPDAFSQRRIEAGLQNQPSLVEAASSPTNTELEVFVSLQPYNKRVRGKKQVREMVESLCLKPHQMKNLPAANEYYITVNHDNDGHLDEIVDDLLHQVYDIAASQKYFAEVLIKNLKTGKTWE